MPDFMKMIQQAQQMQGRLQQMQDELEKITLTASSGGGMVTATADGKGQIKRIQIDPSAISATDVEMLEDLVLVAVTEVQKKAATAAQDEMQKITGGLSLPFKMPF
ncbi:MAG TPA: YbaB/EbfC family nucleoid-associated protein [Gemmatimonadaceae bacterium]|jgi:DNA-binding YbaB/EbfC family protein|nr:YbaB/EbfC family nucleoid-associated protein [Gemmatimonadaceae bacterium]